MPSDTQRDVISMPRCILPEDNLHPRPCWWARLLRGPVNNPFSANRITCDNANEARFDVFPFLFHSSLNSTIRSIIECSMKIRETDSFPTRNLSGGPSQIDLISLSVGLFCNF